MNQKLGKIFARELLIFTRLQMQEVGWGQGHYHWNENLCNALLIKEWQLVRLVGDDTRDALKITWLITRSSAETSNKPTGYFNLPTTIEFA